MLLAPAAAHAAALAFSLRASSSTTACMASCTTGLESEVCVISTMSVLTSLRSSAARGKGSRTLKTWSLSVGPSMPW